MFKPDSVAGPYRPRHDLFDREDRRSAGGGARQPRPGRRQHHPRAAARSPGRDLSGSLTKGWSGKSLGRSTVAWPARR